jgi:hypothetical protein
MRWWKERKDIAAVAEVVPDTAFAGEPPCNGCAERFIRTLKEQCLWARHYEVVEVLRRAVIELTRRYNNEWLIERHGHCTPREAYAVAMETKAA